MKATTPPPTPRRRFAPWKIALVGLGVLIAILMIASGWWLSPLARRKVIQALEQKYESNVEVRSLDVAIFPYPRARIEGLVLRRKTDTGQPPMISIRRADASTGWFAAMRSPRRVNYVSVEGLEINVPRKREGEPEKREASGDGKPRKPAPFEILEMTADGTKLFILPKDPRKEPLVFDIYELRLKSVGLERPMRYDALLRNAKPPGTIDAKGEFGPWNLDDPGQTALNGKYTFSKADLSVFKGIAGVLSSTGEFSGVLEHIDARGQTDTPDFMVTSAGNRVHLKTTFHATIDGSNGDTLLHPVVATFGGTTVRAEGGVTGTPGVKGKTVRLNAVVENGILRDVLALGVKNRPPMTGRIDFRSKIEIPPGDRDVMEKLRLDGQFEISAAKFTSFNIQEKVSTLSERARGDTESSGESDVLTDLRGRFNMSGGTVGLAGLNFAVPGAVIRLDGTYGLKTEQLDFSGTAAMDAKLSQMTTGWKSFLLKGLDPFFKKEHTGAVIPLKISGTRDDPKFGLRLGKK